MRHPDYDALRGMLDDVGPHRARARPMIVLPLTDHVLGPQRRPTLDAVGARRPGRDDHGGLAGTRARRRRARRAAGRPQPQPGPLRPLAWTCSTATRSTPKPSGRTGPRSPSSRSCTSCSSTACWARCARWPGAAAAAPGARDEARADARVRRPARRRRGTSRGSAHDGPRSADLAARRTRGRWSRHREAVAAVLAEPRRSPSRAGTWGCWCRVLRLFGVGQAAHRRRLVGRGDGDDRPRACSTTTARRTGRRPRSSPTWGWAGSPARCCCRTPAGGCASTTPLGWPSWPRRFGARPLRDPRRRRRGSTWARTAALPPDALVGAAARRPAGQRPA